MPTILTVDDSRAMRLMIARELEPLGVELHEAENGQEGLDFLEQQSVDLVLLDVTMPVMDGPDMLRNLRGRGDQTPVILLTAESARTIVAEAMKNGITDYILKPFKNGDLRAKVTKTLGGDIAAAVIEQPPAPPPPPPRSGNGAPARETLKRFTDLLVIDDMDNVVRRLRGLVPEHMTLASCADSQSAISTCRETTFRVILVDQQIPNTQTETLLRQLRILQPSAAFVAMLLRNKAEAEHELLRQGYDGVLFKPFDPMDVDEILGRFVASADVLIREDDLISATSFSGRASRLREYYSRLAKSIRPAVEGAAAACFETIVFDLSSVPPDPARLPRILVAIQESSHELGMAVRVVGNPDIVKLARSFDDTAKMPIFDRLEDARAGGAA